MEPTTVQNVVTYTVVVESPNPELKLLPGMTAKLTFQIDKHENVLKIPTAALRFYPKQPELVRPEDRPLLEGIDEPAKSGEEANESLESQRSAMERAAARKSRNRRHVWVVDDELLRAVPIVVGLSDNKDAEIVSGSLTEGQEVVTFIRARTP
jgi:HlyD family secretion protein